MHVVVMAVRILAAIPFDLDTAPISRNDLTCVLGGFPPRYAVTDFEIS
jgi:hypothetical protein